MADQDFFITIRTTADTAGIKATEAELQRLGVQVESITAAGAEAGRGGSLLGSLAGRIAGGIAGGVGIGFIADQIRQYTSELNKASEEIAKQSARVAELGMKWEESAKQVLTSEDLRKVAGAGMEEFEHIHNQIRAIATEDMPLLESAGDTVARALKNAFTFGGDPGAKGPYEKLRDERIKALAFDEQQLRQQKIHAIELGETYQALFEDLKLAPIDEALGQIGEKITQLETDQQNLDKSAADYLEQYNKINQELGLAERTQKLLLQTEQQRKREAQETARSKQEDVDFWQKQLQQASPQTQAIVRNVQAAQKARAEGRDKDADFFEKTVKQLHGPELKPETPEEMHERFQQSAETMRRVQQESVESMRRHEGKMPWELEERDRPVSSPSRAEEARGIIEAINRLADLWK